MSDTLPPPTETMPARDGMEPLYTYAEAADYLRLSTWWTGELTRRGKLRSVKVGRSVRIPKSALIEYVRGNS